MSMLQHNNSVPVRAQLELLLPGDELRGGPIPPAGLLQAFVSAQSLIGHVALEDVAPFAGVYNIDGLLFIKLDGRTYEVEFDTDNFRFNVVAPRAPAPELDESVGMPSNREQVLRDWHPTYLSSSRKWSLRHVESSVSRNGDSARLMALPYQIDALLMTEDLFKIIRAVERFLLQPGPQANGSGGTQALLPLLAAPHLDALQASADESWPPPKRLGAILDSMLCSAPAQTLADQLLKALDWYGGAEREITVPVIRKQLVWAALMLELNPPAQQQPGYIAGCDLAGPQNWGLSYRQRHRRLLTALAERTALPELALCILAPAVPDFMVEGIHEDLRYGTVAWVNFVHGVSLANSLDPGSSTKLAFEDLIRLPMNLSKTATSEELALIASARIYPSLHWAVANGVLPVNAQNDYSLSELASASNALDDHIERAVQAAEAITRQVPDRLKMAEDKLLELFGDNAEQIKKRLMHPVEISDRFEYAVRGPNSDTCFYLLDLFAAGHLINGMDKFQPVAPNPRLIDWTFARIMEELRGIDIPATFEHRYRFFESQAKLAYTFIIDELWAQLPADDRRALHNGRVKVHTLRTPTGKIDVLEGPLDRERKRGRYGFVLECSYLRKCFFYELFPLAGIAVRHASLSIPTTSGHEFSTAPTPILKVTTGRKLPIDWNAYVNLAEPVSGTKSTVISETIAEFGPSDDLDNNASAPLTSARLNQISVAVATHHLFFYPHDTYHYHRDQTGSEYVSNNYPPILRSLAVIVPGLGCVNGIATNDSPVFACSLDAVTLGVPALKLLGGTMRLALNAGKAGITQTLPRFAWLWTSIIMQSAHAHRAMRAAGTLTPRVLGSLLRAKVLDIKAFHALANRLRSYTVPANSATRHVSGIPTITHPTEWRGPAGFDSLATVSEIDNVPVRRLSNALAGRKDAHYLLGSGAAYGPRLIARQSASISVQGGGVMGYPLSGRGAGGSSIASPDGGKLGRAIDPSEDLATVLSQNNISATPEQLRVIANVVEDGTPLFIYQTGKGSKSIALHDVHDRIYVDAFTNTRVSVFRFYNHATLKTWRVDPAIEAGVLQVAPQRLAAGRGQLIQKRLDEIGAGISEGQYLPPIHVGELANGAYPVVNGNHRLAVALQMQLETVPVLIV